MRQEVKQRFSLVEVAAGDGDICQDGCGKWQSRREVASLCNLQRNPRRGIGFRKGAEAKFQQANSAVDGNKSTRAARTVDPLAL